MEGWHPWLASDVVRTSREGAHLCGNPLIVRPVPSSQLRYIPFGQCARLGGTSAYPRTTGVVALKSVARLAPPPLLETSLPLPWCRSLRLDRHADAATVWKVSRPATPAPFSRHWGCGCSVGFSPPHFFFVPLVWDWGSSEQLEVARDFVDFRHRRRANGQDSDRAL